MRGFNTMLMAPELERLQDVWTDVVLIDGNLLPGEAALIREKCPRARLVQMRANPDLAALLAQLCMDRDALARLYVRLRQGGTLALSALAQNAQLTSAQTLTGLMALHQAKLAQVSLEPYALRLLPVAPGTRANPLDTPLMKYIAAAGK